VVAAALAGAVPDQPTHGDLYEGQLLVAHGRIRGLLDVDSAGPGRRADDLACLLAHLETLAVMDLRHRDRLRALARDWYAEFERHVDAHELRTRVAGVLLSLATGPHRVQESGWEAATRRRLDLVEEWLAPSASRARALA
jgi:Ser/Thr protein kinase RdoA (MazF antagonist)